MKPCPSGEMISFEALPVRVDSGGVILLLRHGVCLFVFEDVFLWRDKVRFISYDFYSEKKDD